MPDSYKGLIWGVPLKGYYKGTIRVPLKVTIRVPMVSLGIIFCFCSYKAQEDIKNSIYIMVQRGGLESLSQV